MNPTQEINFDGIVGPTHNYAGLSPGNLASECNRDSVARPREAALQGLAKMAELAALGLAQGVLPPQERPAIRWLRALGFGGDDGAVWATAWTTAPMLARQAAAASSMWAANAATVSPSADCADGRLHLTPANLISMPHRAIEAAETMRALRALLPDASLAIVHDPLPGQAGFADEGAANHLRLAAEPETAGLEIFVYGRAAAEPTDPGFPARQTREAGEAIARRHGLKPSRTLHLRQSRAAIEAGAFHNDVVAVSHENVLFFHEHAYAEESAALLRAAAADATLIAVPAAAISLDDAVQTYLFNSQLVRIPGAAKLTLIAPREAEENPRVFSYLAKVADGDGPIGAVRFVDVRESMRNGGGPACLRLRIAMTEAERRAASAGFFLDEALRQRLQDWITRHYRETLAPTDLGDPAIVDETHRALDELTRILPLGPRFYDFQRP